MAAPRGWLRWALPGLVSWLLFVNHYARDITGALEREIEAGFGVTKAQYGLLNSIYFVPNIAIPFLMGAVAQSTGAHVVLVLTIVLSSVGHIVVGCSGVVGSFRCLLLGRVVLGLCYETIDMLPLPILGSDFKDMWAFLVGIFSAFLRMGSVMNFVMSPVIYRRFGLSAALWVSSWLGLSGLGAVFLIWRLRMRTRRMSAHNACSLTAGGAEAELQGAEPAGSEHRTHEVSGAVLQALRYAGFPCHFWWFCATGMLMYSAIVPFWFFGSRYIQETFGHSLQEADTLMLLPEGMIAVLGPPVGIHVDQARWTPRKTLFVLSTMLAFFPMAYALLLVAWVPPLLSMLLLGSGWAVSNCLFWSLSTHLMPPELFALGSGILGSALNVGATVLPYAMGHLSDPLAMGSLILAAGGASLAALCTGLVNKKE